MEENDIHKLFLTLVEHPSQNSEAIREVFTILVRSTLKYRDHVLKSTGVVVKVEDVQAALNWLMPALSTGQLPDTDDRLRLDLLKLWLDEIKVLGTPHRYLS